LEAKAKLFCSYQNLKNEKTKSEPGQHSGKAEQERNEKY
jgi:hypothetical protein